MDHQELKSTEVVEQKSENNLLEKLDEGVINREENKRENIQTQTQKKRKGDQFLIKRTNIDEIDIKSLNEEEKAELKVKLENECLQISNCYLEELAIDHKWDTFENIKMANDSDPDDLFDENNQKLKAKLKIIGLMVLGGALSYYFEKAWIYFVFQIGALLPHIFDILNAKEEYDSYVVPNKDAYFTQSYISFGFKKLGKGRAREQDKSLYPKAVELYEYFKENLTLIRSLRPSNNKQKQ